MEKVIRSFTKKDAKKVAKIFLRHPKINKVFVFGSISRGECGNDIDIILTTKRDTFEKYFLLIKKNSEKFIKHYQSKSVRFLSAVDVLYDGVSFTFSLIKKSCGTELDYIDVFIFPDNWKEELKYLQKKFSHSDKNFMENIARDSIEIEIKN